MLKAAHGFMLLVLCVTLQNGWEKITQSDHIITCMMLDCFYVDMYKTACIAGANGAKTRDVEAVDSSAASATAASKLSTQAPKPPKLSSFLGDFGSFIVPLFSFVALPSTK